MRELIEILENNLYTPVTSGNERRNSNHYPKTRWKIEDTRRNWIVSVLGMNCESFETRYQYPIAK